MSEQSGISRPDPEDDPFARSICGQALTTTERIENDGYCDGCLREYGVMLA